MYQTTTKFPNITTSAYSQYTYTMFNNIFKHLAKDKEDGDAEKNTENTCDASSSVHKRKKRIAKSNELSVDIRPPILEGERPMVENYSYNYIMRRLENAIMHEMILELSVNGRHCDCAGNKRVIVANAADVIPISIMVPDGERLNIEMKNLKFTTGDTEESGITVTYDSLVYSIKHGRIP